MSQGSDKVILNESNRGDVLHNLKQDGTLLMMKSDAIQANKEMVLTAVTQNGCALQYASDNLKDDKEVVLSAVKQDASAYIFASDNLKRDVDIMLVAEIRLGIKREEVKDEINNLMTEVGSE